MKFSKTLVHTTAIMLIGTGVVYADNQDTSKWDLDAEGRIGNLPESGSITVSGTVHEVEDQDTFILRDKTGETIDVHTSNAVNLRQGARVRVSGQITDEALGVGEEITAANVTVLDHQSGNMGANGMRDTNVTGNQNLDKSANNNSLNRDRTASLGNNDTNSLNRDRTASLDNEDQVMSMSADVSKTGEVQKANRNSRANIQDNRDIGSSRSTVAAYDMDVDADLGENANAANQNLASTEMAGTDTEGTSRIENLPAQGRIVLTGTVAEVNNDKKFTLRDTAGETIDVNTVSNVAVTRGDTVKVMGSVKSEFAGMGQEIQATDVVRVNQRR